MANTNENCRNEGEEQLDTRYLDYGDRERGNIGMGRDSGGRKRNYTRVILERAIDHHGSSPRTGDASTKKALAEQARLAVKRSTNGGLSKEILKLAGRDPELWADILSEIEGNIRIASVPVCGVGLKRLEPGHDTDLQSPILGGLFAGGGVIVRSMAERLTGKKPTAYYSYDTSQDAMLDDGSGGGKIRYRDVINYYRQTGDRYWNFRMSAAAPIPLIEAQGNNEERIFHLSLGLPDLWADNFERVATGFVSPRKMLQNGRLLFSWQGGKFHTGQLTDMLKDLSDSLLGTTRDERDLTDTLSHSFRRPSNAQQFF